MALRKLVLSHVHRPLEADFFDDGWMQMSFPNCLYHGIMVRLSECNMKLFGLRGVQVEARSLGVCGLPGGVLDSAEF